jgi:hypothetical protein
MLSGMSRERSMRSNSCWFTEFCKSQCLSHFAAPFIVVRAKTSVAVSCETKKEGRCSQAGGHHCQDTRCVAWSQGSRPGRRAASRGLRAPAPRYPCAAARKGGHWTTLARTAHCRRCRVLWISFVRMILPQVHLRKPCYDFSFL